ncbi:hypothetical protein B0O99DRAFT_606525 [Bisporella sp. PMI_857]|nr:hypothetical protein B0O99DRAFT_606525 [Bisporella sp. PMI_857]
MYRIYSVRLVNILVYAFLASGIFIDRVGELQGIRHTSDPPHLNGCKKTPTHFTTWVVVFVALQLMISTLS